MEGKEIPMARLHQSGIQIELDPRADIKSFVCTVDKIQPPVFFEKNKRKNRFFFCCVQSEKERILVSLSLQLVFNSRRYFNDERKTSIHLSLSSQHLFLFFVFDFGGQTENGADRWQFPFFIQTPEKIKGGGFIQACFY